MNFKFHGVRKKHVRIAITVAVLGFAGLGAWQLVSGAKPNLPAEFTNARLQGALIGQTIVSDISGSNDRLKQISLYDINRDYENALDTTAYAMEENKKISENAVQLSKQLEIMLQRLPEVQPVEAQAKAQEALLAEVQLINKLISYSDLLKQLLEELKLKIRASSNGVAEPGVEIQKRIEDINREIRNINALNDEFLNTMKEFDTYFAK